MQPHWPQIGVGAVVQRDGCVLLVRRGTAPYAHRWAIPGGRQRPGETLQQAAEREILEETGIRICAGKLIYHTEYIEHDASGGVRYHYVILDLEGEYLDGEPVAGDDALEARWVNLADAAQLDLNDTTRVALERLFPALRQGAGETASGDRD